MLKIGGILRLLSLAVVSWPMTGSLDGCVSLWILGRL